MDSVTETLAAESDGSDTLASGALDASPRLPGPAGDDEPGATIGRYVVLSRLGAGAMGVVLAAFDPELDRKVAVKLLHGDASHDEAARVRLQREAQALAKLSHPNVVGVHDVGVHDGHVFVAMEFVEGATLGDWLQARARPDGGAPWSTVLPVFAAAGRGLAAAHSQGLIHRDFKPDNVMIDGAGRVRVMDFGLARAHGTEDDTNSEVPTGTAGDLASIQLTRTGAMMGTPAYMAPEQFLAGEVTPRTDQFGFCVALYEALHGVRPFEGETLQALAMAVTQGKLREAPPHAAPRWLAAVLRRGLAPDPERRFRDMPALLDALASGERSRRRGWIAAGVGGLLLTGTGALGVDAWERTQVVDACEREAAEIEAHWNEEKASEVRRGLTASGFPDAARATDSIVGYLDAQANAIGSAQANACMDARVHERSTLDMHARATWCLDARRMELGAVADMLTNADRDVAIKALKSAASLAPVGPCTDPNQLASRPEPPPVADLDRAREALAMIGTSRARETAGEYDQALAAARGAADLAGSIGAQVLRVDGHYLPEGNARDRHAPSNSVSNGGIASFLKRAAATVDLDSVTPPRLILPNQTCVITCRAVSRSFRFVPTKWVTDTLWYILGYVVEVFEIDVHEVIYMSNHYHLVLTDRGCCLPAFMNRLNSLTSRALNALRGSTGTNIEKGYEITRPQDAARILEHCAYTLANPCAADLVGGARHWKGITTVNMDYGAIKTIQRPNYGLWTPQDPGTKKKKRKTQDARDPKRTRKTKMPETVHFKLVPPPTDDGASPDELRERIRSQLAALEKKAEARRAEQGKTVAGMRSVRSRSWTTIPRPEELFQRRPKFSASGPAARIAALELWRAFVKAYRAAVELWTKKRKRATEFPMGTWLMRKRFSVRCAVAGPAIA